MSTQYVSRPVFNYPLPDDFYQFTHRSHTRGVPFHPDSVPRSMCIDPQHLMMASPLSPPPEDCPFPVARYPSPPGPRMEARSPMEYMGPGSRKRSAPTILYQDQNHQPSYELERASGHRPSRSSSNQSIPYHYHHSGMNIDNSNMHHEYSTLPTPPLSPSSTIPLPSSSIHLHMSTSTSTSPDSYSQTDSPTTLISPDLFPHATTTAIESNNSGQRFYCTQVICTNPVRICDSSFSRRADVARHHNIKHAARKVFHNCPRPNCARKGTNGFTRLDHLKEHRRGYHGEDIPKRGGANASTRARKERVLDLDLDKCNLGEVEEAVVTKEKRRRRTR